MKRTKTKSIFGALCLFFAISLFSVFCSISFNTISVSAYSAAISTSNSVTLDATINGTGTSIKAEAINIQTDCRAGYNLNIAAPNGSNLYLNGNNSGNASFTAVDGTSALSSSSNTNKWGYTLATNPTSSTVFLPLSANTSVLKTPAQTASPNSNINDTFNINYGVHTDETITPGAYRMGNNGTIVYYLTMDESCMTVNIAYDGNNADAGTMGAVGTGVIHTRVKDGDTVNLIASNFSRTGYGFAGWSTDQNAGAKLIDNDNTNNPIVYGPQETVTLPNGFTNYDTDNDGIVKLYAVWIPSQGNLQGWAGCANLDTATYDSTTGALDLTKKSVTALTDQRDNDTYAVARLADGQCWMIENLRLESTNTDNSTGNLAQGYGTSTTYGNFSGLADAESTNFTSSTTVNSLYYSGTQEGAASINIGTSDDPAYRMPRYNNWNNQSTSANRPQNPTTNDATNSTTNAGMYSYGNYYTWHAAIADTTYYSSGDHNTTSICPTGWQLPLGNTSTGDIEQGAADAANKVGGFSYLDRKMGGTGANQSTTAGSLRWRKFPVNFLYSGVFSTSSAGSRGSRGYYWSSTASNSRGSYRMGLDNSNVYPGTNSYSRYNGSSIRCVAPSNLYAVHFDANTTDAVTGTMPNQSITTDTATNLRSNAFQRPATSSTAYRFVKWNTRAEGTGTDYADGASVTNLVPVGQTITLYAQWEQITPMTVNFNGNGLNYDDSASVNTVYYDNNNCSIQSITKNSHTSNINDDGTQIGTTKYDNNLVTKDVVTIPGASSLHATITYGTENNWDMLYVFQGEYTGSVTRNMSAGQLATYMGGNNTTTTVELDIPGDTATFAFYSDGSGQYWGYYASITGVDSNNNPITGEVCTRSLVSGGYKEPVTGSLRTFYGWSENQSADTADYATADDVLNKLPGNNGETKTLYAIWKNNLTINYNANGGSGTTASQTVAAGESIALKSNGFTAPTNKQFRNWNTKADGTGTSYSANTNFTAPNNVAYNDSLTLYAIWDDVYYISFNANGGSGTMTNQTVPRDTATAIKTSTFTRSGFIFRGWNTKDDGTGTFYGDGQKVTNLTTTGNTITLYAVWVEGAYLDTGQNVNYKLKRLAGNSSASYSTQDNTITALVRSNTLPDGFTPSTANTISVSSSPYPIYAWYDAGSTTIYYYSAATNIIMNKNSSHLFYEMRALSNLSTISTWDTVKVTNMFYMFSYAGYSATTWSVGDLSSWNTSSVTDMSGMFYGAGRSATTWSVGDLSSWNTSGVTNMSYMFSNAGYSAATWSINGLSSWDTSSVTSMSSMFFSAGRSAIIFTLDLSSWDTSSVTDVSNMFYQAGYSATTWSVGDLSSWNTSSVTNMSNMFSYAGYSATTWSVGDLSSWDTSSVKDMSNMFYQAGHNATTWFVGDLSSWNTSSVTNMSYMFSNAGYSVATFTLDLSSWNTSSVTSMSAMFNSAGYSATTWSVGDLSSWNTSSVTSMSNMFESAGYNVATFTLNLSSWNTSRVTDMSRMFYNAGRNATTWSVTIPRTNNGTATGPISNTTSNLYGSTTSVTATPPSGRSFTLAN